MPPDHAPTPHTRDPTRAQTFAEIEAFAVDGVRASQGPSGFLFLDVDTPLCSGQLALFGAQVMRWAPRGQHPVLHVSPQCVYRDGKGMRGGVPVCFPWFADRTADPRPGGAPSPLHGFLRTRAWRLESLMRDDDGVRCELVTRDDDQTRALWPHAFEARLRASLGATLTVALEVANTGASAFSFEAALHSYFEVGDVARAEVDGLEPGRYIDKVDGRKEKHWDGRALDFSGEVDAVFLDRSRGVTIVDRALERTLRVEKSGSRTTVVWNPGPDLAAHMPDVGPDSWRRFVCVETANALPHAITLAAGASHAMSQRVAVMPSATLP